MIAATVAAAGVLLAASPADPACRGLSLTDVAIEAGLRFEHVRGARGEKHLPETMGAGVAWLDFDGDGRLDLYAVQSGPFPPDGDASAANRLFRNNGDGTFEDVTERTGAGDRGYGQGALASDLDGDGHVDLYVTNYGPDVFLRNRGDGTFEDATAQSGLGLDGWSSSAAAADADGDGDLDLYVARYLEFDPRDAIYCGDVERGVREYCDPTLFEGAADVLYENTGSGRFRQLPELPEARGKGLGVLFADLDDDRLPEIYVANDLTINVLYRNRGGLSFDAESLFSGAGLNRDGKAEAGMGLALGDVDEDGDPDLIVSNFDVETNTLYRNVGGLQFEDHSAPSGFGSPSFNLLGFGTVLADLNRDGALDVYVANGHIFEAPRRENVRYRQPDLLLLGDGRGAFRAAACGPSFDTHLVGRGLAAADYDDDGDVDLAVLNSGGPLQLLRNDGTTAGWIGVRLRADPPNVEAIGAYVVLERGGPAQRRWVLAGDSYQSSSDRRALFALPADSSAATLRVRWPDGAERTFVDLETNRYLTIDRDTGPAEATPAPRGDVPGFGARAALAGVAAAALLVLVVLAAALRRRRRS